MMNAMPDTHTITRALMNIRVPIIRRLPFAFRHSSFRIRHS